MQTAAEFPTVVGKETENKRESRRRLLLWACGGVFRSGGTPARRGTSATLLSARRSVGDLDGGLGVTGTSRPESDFQNGDKKRS